VVEYQAKLTDKKLVGKLFCELRPQRATIYGSAEWWVLVEKEPKRRVGLLSQAAGAREHERRRSAQLSDVAQPCVYAESPTRQSGVGIDLTLLNAVSRSTRSPGRERPSPRRMLSEGVGIACGAGGEAGCE
jgi:hypothetical protein